MVEGAQSAAAEIERAKRAGRPQFELRRLRPDSDACSELQRLRPDSDASTTSSSESITYMTCLLLWEGSRGAGARSSQAVKRWELPGENKHRAVPASLQLRDVLPSHRPHEHRGEPAMASVIAMC